MVSLPKKRKNFKIKTLIVVLILVVGGFYLLQHLLVSQFQKNFEEVLNSNPERAYDFRYRSLSLDLLRTQVKMEGITIAPINVDTSASNTIRGEVEMVLLNGVGVIDFLTNQTLTIEELRFEEPKFTLVHKEREQTKNSSGSFQALFQDIISRGEIKNFTLNGGEAGVFVRTDTLRQIGSFDGFHIEAKNLSTDIERLNYAIPFQFDDLHTAFSNLTLQLKEGQNLKLEQFDFHFKNESLFLKGLSLSYDKDWTSVALEEEFQKDIIEFSIGSINADKLSPLSTFYNSFVLISDRLLIDSLFLNDGRDKNIPRPPDEIKRNYTAIIKSLDVPIRIDTLEITNSQVTYSEINDGSRAIGTLRLMDLNSKLFNVTTIDSVKLSKPFRMELKALLNGAGEVTLKAIEDYETLNVNAELTLGPMDMKSLNPTLINLAGVEIKNGKLNGLRAQMNWDSEGSKNRFIIDYENLEVEVLKKNSNDRDKFLTRIGKAAYHQSHIKGDKHYHEPEYYSYRNKYRGPFNFLWVNVKDGVFQTVPSGVARLFIPKPSKPE